MPLSKYREPSGQYWVLMTAWFQSARLIAIVCAVAIFIGGTAGASEETTKPADEPSVSPFDARIGWLDVACLVLRTPPLHPGRRLPS
jgi:hypothetical protein